LILLIGGLFYGIKAAGAAAYCNVTYTVTSQWPGSPGGFNVQAITIQNVSGSAWSSWSLTFTFPAAGQSVQSNPWNGTFTQSGQNVTVTNAPYNNNVANNANVNPAPGFNGNWTTSNPIPTNFAVNGNACNGGGTNPTATPTQSGNTPTSTPTGNTPTATPTRINTPTATPTTTGPTPTPCTSCPHLDNPYVGAQGYINPDWAAEVRAGAATKTGTLAQQEARVANFSTAVWMDSKNAVTGTGYPRSLIGHLDAAVAQAASGGPVVIEIVIYDLPGRDCAALASNGEIPATAAGLTDYETNYIDPIANAFNQTKYRNLRIVAIIEPDSLPNLVTNLNYTNPNTGQQTCATVNSGGYYVNGVRYALNKLHAIPNVYNYVDIGHDGWLGWDTNFNPAITLIGGVIKGATAGVNSIDGFITDTANYTPFTEPFMTANQTVGGNPVRSATFFQWNTYIDEQTYGTAWRNAMISSQSFPSTIGMLYDSARAGWGGPNRPTAASTSTSLETFVNATRIDKRNGRGNWCNQPGGIGARPTANPAAGWDAFVWIKPPGESDGSATAIPQGPDNPAGKGFDRMCDPTYGGNQLNNNLPTGSIAGAPVSGAWFQAGFDILVQNAFPSL
jgi:cellulose 1,4-beta-cellobiosidase